MKPETNLRVQNGREKAVALVIVLSFVVLLTVAVVAFLSRATTERQVSGSSANSERANTLALGALDVVVGDLKDEIIASSTASSSGGYTIYSPKMSASVPVGMMPWRTGVPKTGATPIPNLVSRSVRSSDAASDSPYVPYSSDYTSPPVNRAADDGTDDTSSAKASLNGRSVSLARWNSHYLIPRLNVGSITIESSPVSSFVPPDWVLVSRDGPVSATGIGAGSTAVNQSSATNGRYVIGRYAYAVYDEGGMLDLNVAGYPTPAPIPAASPPQPSAFKGSLAFADLTASSGVNLPQDQLNKIVEWRNYASIAAQSTPANTPSGTVTGSGANYFTAASANDYSNYVRARSDGFLSTSVTAYPSPATATSRTDHSFTTRQDLLRLRRMTGFSQDALQYLGTFSRELNAPSFSPTTPTVINPNFAQVLVTTPFTRFDGSPAAAGEALVQKRFPLSRLAWITYKGPSALLPATDSVITQLRASGVSAATIAAGTPANIQACFGLTYTATDLWIYNHGTATSILNLTAVATAGREPDFFELLQAAILTGSLGQNTGGGVTPVTGGIASTVFPDVHMANTAHHVLSIGAAIIDQSDPDSIPTRLQITPGTTAWTAYGVESLPYISQMYPAAGISPDDPTKWATYLLFQLWNPHQNVPMVLPAVRLRVDGGLGLFRGGNGEVWTNTGTDSFHAAGGSIALSSATAFAPSPAPLLTANSVVTATTPGSFVALPAPPSSATMPLVGYRLPDYGYAAPSPRPAATPVLWLQIGASTTPPTLSTRNQFNAAMEVDVGGGNFVPYNHFIGINDTASWIKDDPIALRTASSIITGAPRAFSAAQLRQVPPPAFMKADPRATRFGLVQTNAVSSNATITEPLWPSATLPNGYGGAIADPGGLVEHAPVKFVGSPYFPATLALNAAASTSTRTGYSDNDTFQRPADSVYPEPTPFANPTPRYSTAYFPASTPAPSPTPPPNSIVMFNDYSPIVLNRPFHSVGELGYAFRDLPWKTLDFFTETSGDAGLLDVFSVNDEPKIIAGRINLNTRQAPALQSILAGALVSELEASNTVFNTGASALAAPVIAANITSATSAAPLRDISQLITRTTLPVVTLPVPASGSAHNQRVKAKREVIPRALASVAESRTWNLLIDVIAQSGRYPPTAGNLSDFVVEGEKRYWLHVAIDRFTGQVIDQQLEAVYE